MSVERQKRELIIAWTRQLNSWMRSIKANGNKKRVAISLLTQHETSIGYQKLYELGGDYNALWNWFLKNIENDITGGLGEHGGASQPQDHLGDRTFEFEIVPSSGGGGGTHSSQSDEESRMDQSEMSEAGYEHSDVLNRMDNGACNARIEVGLLEWNENNKTRRGRQTNNILVLHEFAHHYKFLLGCFSAKRTAEGQFAETERVSAQIDQRIVLQDIYGLSGAVKVFVLNHTKGLAIDDLSWVPADGLSDPEGALEHIEEDGYYLWDCVALDEGGLGSYFDHAQGLAEQSAYFAEWLQGHPMTGEHYDKLYSGRSKLLSFDWGNGTCQQAGRMKQAVNRATRYHGVPFRFAGLIDLNLDIGKEAFVNLVNDLAKSVSVGAQAPTDKGSEQSYDTDPGTRVASVINNLIKLANTFDSAGLINHANHIDAVIRKVSNKD